LPQTPVATHEDFVYTIHRTWKYIKEVWLQQSSYKYRGGPASECYKEQSRAFSERIYIRLKKRKRGGPAINRGAEIHAW
jgi:AraC family transcriptional regulator